MLTKLRIKKIDLYILTEVIAPLLGGLVFFTFIFLMFQLLRLADLFILHGVSLFTLGKMTLLMIITFLPTTLPIAFLISVLIAFGRLSTESELVAMKSSGISILRLTLPVLILSLVVSLLSLGLNMEWAPKGDLVFKSTLIKVSNTKIVSSLKEGAFNTGFFDLLIFTDKYDNKTNRLKRVFLFDEREAKTPVVVIAQEGEIISVKPNTELGAAAVLKLYSGNIHRNNVEDNNYQKIDFDQYRLYLQVDEGDGGYVTKPKMIPYQDLLKLIETSPKTSFGYREALTEIWKRLMVGTTPLIFVFLGIGYGTIRIRAVRSGAAAMAFIIIFLYWSVQAFGTVAAQEGYLPPAIAMILPNLLILVLAMPGFKSAMW